MDTKSSSITRKIVRTSLSLCLLIAIFLVISFTAYLDYFGGIDKSFVETSLFDHFLEEMVDQSLLQAELKEAKQMDLSKLSTTVEVIGFDQEGKRLSKYSNVANIWQKVGDEELALSFKRENYLDNGNQRTKVVKDFYASKLIYGDYGKLKNHYLDIDFDRFINSELSSIHYKFNYKIDKGELGSAYQAYSHYQYNYKLIFNSLWVLLVGGFFIGLFLLLSSNKTDLFAFLDGIYLELRILAFTLCFPILESCYQSIFNYRFLNSSPSVQLNFWLNIFRPDSIGAMILAAIVIMTMYELLVSLVRNLKAKELVDKTLVFSIVKKIYQLFIRMFSAVESQRIFFPQLVIYVAVYAGCNLILAFFLFHLYSGYLVLSTFALIVLLNYFVLNKVYAYLEAVKKIDKYTSYALNSESPKPLSTENLPESLKQFSQKINHLSQGMSLAVEDAIKNERMRSELITNVTHDLKNPLTSIISYADLLQKIELNNTEAEQYRQVIYEKSLKLKDLIDHLVEAAKISSGVSELKKEKVDLVAMTKQIAGEYHQALADKQLDLILNVNVQSLIIETDPSYYARILDNLFTNVVKYALSGTRVYLSLEIVNQKAELSLKNISEAELDIKEEELFERFVRGDKARSQEGNGLGLSIAKTLAHELDIELKIVIDGDLFKVILVHSDFE